MTLMTFAISCHIDEQREAKVADNMYRYLDIFKVLIFV